jgi:uncharacterized protein YecE (DUF72 family)
VGSFLYGTSSWSEPSWVGPFYPPGTEPADFLRLYAEHFRTVEADVTYYRVPDERLVDGWTRRTPEGFVLSAKFPRSIVHCGTGPQPDASRLLVLEHCAQDLAAFLGAMGRLGPRCGPLVLQFRTSTARASPSAGPSSSGSTPSSAGCPRTSATASSCATRPGSTRSCARCSSAIVRRSSSST